MKEIKDYLHLYLGCEVKDDYDNDYKQLEAIFYDNNQCYLKGRGRVTLHTRNLNEVQPVLRPLSNMNEDEYMIAGKITLGAHYTNTPNIEAVAEYTKYLLSKHFDLFGLIEAGLAIDKTTIK